MSEAVEQGDTHQKFQIYRVHPFSEDSCLIQWEFSRDCGGMKFDPQEIVLLLVWTLTPPHNFSPEGLPDLLIREAHLNIQGRAFSESETGFQKQTTRTLVDHINE